MSTKTNDHQDQKADHKMQVQIIDIQTQEILAQGSIDQIKAIYEEEDVLEAIDQAAETQQEVIVYGFVGNGIKITTTESSNEMHQSPKCGLFPTVDKRHLQEGISQEQKSEIKKQSIGDIINNAGVIFFHMFFWAMFFFSLLFFGE